MLCDIMILLWLLGWLESSTGYPDHAKRCPISTMGYPRSAVEYPNRIMGNSTLP